MATKSSAQVSAPVHYRSTTADQRCLLFNSVEQSDNVSAAARRAHVGRGTYYYWQARYDAEGLAGLANDRSRAPHHSRIPAISAELQAEVLAYQRVHPTEGCRRIAHAVNQAHDWQKVIGHTRVRELVMAGRPAMPSSAEAAPALVSKVVHAPQPNQTVNIDLCVVPVSHSERSDWLSLSLTEAAAGVCTATAAAPSVAEWPGQVFADPTLPYAEQMHRYVAQRTAKRLSRGQRKHRRRQKQAARADWNAQSDELRLQHRHRRIARGQEDQAWQAPRQAHRDAEHTWQRLSASERAQRRTARRAQQKQWRVDKALRRAQQRQRQTEDVAWRQARRELRTQLAQVSNELPLVTTWLAILVVVCNGTRRCLGLPLFTAGVHVTADMIVLALRGLCPPELAFIISDNGPQFIADVFAQFVTERELTHARIAPQRPCTNGIAERFVRTLKEWLATQSWNSPDELPALLTEFIDYYNDRPHQGAELDGLSPNEFARRLCDCLRC
jgi:transposase InsO family protein